MGEIMAEKDGGGQTSTRMTQDGQYRLLVEAITDYAIYMLDPSGVVKSWNPGAERFKGSGGGNSRQALLHVLHTGGSCKG